VSRFPAAFRLPAFASRSSDSRRGVGPSLRSADRTRSSGPRRGLPRSARTSYDRGGCLLYPEDGDAHPAGPSSPTGACRFPAASPYTPLRHPIGGASDNEASTEVHAIHPSGLPLACGPRMERAPLGFSPELRTTPAQHRRRTSGWGRALSTSPGLRSRHQPDLQSAHPLETCDLVSQGRTVIMRSTARRSTPRWRHPSRDFR
jgi:hypothetical protein